MEGFDSEESAPGTKRFRKLRKSIEMVSPKVLTTQLRQKEDSGLIVHTVFAEVPPRVKYMLTKLGYSLKSVLDAMGTLATEYKARQA